MTPRRLDAPWSASERRTLDRLRTPAAIQAFLDGLAYSTSSSYRCPRSVLRDRRAHCLDGALLAAAALRRIGHPALLVDMEAVRDDDHVLAVFRRQGLWGAVAKSNCVGLRYREPVHRSIRELAMSYFDQYFNTRGERTLRRVSAPVRLDRFDRLGWLVRDDAAEAIVEALIATRHFELLPPGRARTLVRVDRRSFQAGFLGADRRGLYKA